MNFEIQAPFRVLSKLSDQGSRLLEQSCRLLYYANVVVALIHNTRRLHAVYFRPLPFDCLNRY